MCTVSAVMPQIEDAFKKLPQWGQGVSFPSPILDPRVGELAKDVKDVLARLDRIDKALGLRDCAVEAEAKKEFLAKLDALSKAAENLSGR